MHSSRMGTVRCSDVVMEGDLCLGGCLSARRVSARGVSAYGVVCPGAVDRMTDGCKTITLPQSLLRTVITATGILHSVMVIGS